MATCTSCGGDVTGKKFCPQCGTAVQPLNTSVITCPHCSGEVSPSAAFCMHCGAALRAQAASQPTTRACPACHVVQPAQTAFCTSCGHNMNVTAASAQTPYQASQYQPSQYGQPSQYPQPQAQQYGQPQYSQPQAQQYEQSQYSQPQAQQYGQPQYSQPQYSQPYDPYTQGSYQPQPMMGQGPMVLRCPTCMAMAPVGTPACLSCRTNLAGVVPTPANVQNQQGGFLQGNGGKFAMGALGGAAAVIGGEMLLKGLENAVEGDRGYGEYEHRRHHHREEGLLGELGELGNDIGLF